MQEKWSVVNAWREVLARTFEGVSLRENVTPSWMVNPASGRRLKLDQLYPEVGVAIRFRGLQGTRRRRPSEEEEAQESAREEIRADLCHQAGVYLVTVDLVEGEPKEVFKQLRSALSSAASALSHSSEPHERKVKLMEQIAAHKKACNQLGRRIRTKKDLSVYAELWDDRTYAALDSTPEPARLRVPAIAYETGMSVWHATFGQGEVMAVEADGDETFVTVQFGDDHERRFAASLVQDKLLPR